MKQVMKLELENKRLKEIVISKCGTKSREILMNSCFEVMPDVVATCANQATSLIQKSDFVLMKVKSFINYYVSASQRYLLIRLFI